MFDELINESEEVVDEVTASSTTYTDTFNQARNTYLEAVRAYVTELRADQSIDLREVNLRFSTALNISRIKTKRIVVIGLGGIGSWVAQTLVGMGAENICLVDPDTVEIHNVGPQAYFLSELGMLKTEAMKQRILQFRGISVDTVANKAETLSDLVLQVGTADIIVSAVDNMTFRNEFAESFGVVVGGSVNTHSLIDQISTLPELFIDLRMTLGIWNAFTLPLRELAALAQHKPEFITKVLKKYAEMALFDDSEGMQGACTERAIIYTGANIAAYTAALTHWYVNRTERFDVEEFFSDYVVPSKFTWFKTFSAMSFTDGTPRKPIPPITVTDPIVSDRIKMFTAAAKFAHSLGKVQAWFSAAYRFGSLAYAQSQMFRDYTYMDYVTDQTARCRYVLTEAVERITANTVPRTPTVYKALATAYAQCADYINEVFPRLPQDDHDQTYPNARNTNNLSLVLPNHEFVDAMQEVLPTKFKRLVLRHTEDSTNYFTDAEYEIFVADHKTINHMLEAVISKYDDMWEVGEVETESDVVEEESDAIPEERIRPGGAYTSSNVPLGQTYEEFLQWVGNNPSAQFASNQETPDDA